MNQITVDAFTEWLRKNRRVVVGNMTDPTNNPITQFLSTVCEADTITATADIIILDNNQFQTPMWLQFLWECVPDGPVLGEIVFYWVNRGFQR